MYYYALFLGRDGYIEKCLSLIRFISNPSSSNLPHITLRVFQESKANLDYLNDIRVSYLNIIEPGIFDVTNRKVIYLRCESEELEFIEYKPDYPQSRLHITLYEGENLTYAKALFSLINKEKWHFKLSFNPTLKLTEKKIGSKNSLSLLNYFHKICEEIIGEDFDSLLSKINNDEYKLRLVSLVLNRISDHVLNESTNTKLIDSYYSKKPKRESRKYTDASSNTVRYKQNNQLSFDLVYPDRVPQVDKSVRDAIFVTPPEYARDMAYSALKAFGDDSIQIDFGDSAIGTGALFLALKQCVEHSNESFGTNFSVLSAVGVDIDKRMAEEAFVRYSKRGLAVIYGDSISPSINFGAT